MLAWGLLLGVLPNVLIVAGLWWGRDKITGGGRGARVALMLSCVALLADAAVNLAVRGLGAPFVLFLLAPATIALAVLIPQGDAARPAALIGRCLTTSHVLSRGAECLGHTCGYNLRPRLPSTEICAERNPFLAVQLQG
jgi:hypothetical protein